MIEKLIKKIGHQLDIHKIPYMIIGGQAVLLYGYPRLTRDVDITLGIDNNKLSVLLELITNLGLKILPKNVENFVKDTNVLPTEENILKVRVDFIFSFTPYEEQAIKRAKKVNIYGYPVKFASCEDLIIHKMFAGRAVDEEDVKNILSKNITSINIKYIRKWLQEFHTLTGQEKIVDKFYKVLEAAGQKVNRNR